MKRLFVALAILGAVSIANSSKAQVYIGARVGAGFPRHRVFCAPPAAYALPYVRAPYFRERVVVTPPVYGYRHYDSYRHERRWRGRRW